MVPLLALAVFINYVDRGNLATAMPLMKDQLGLTGTQVGVLASAFYWTYTPGQPLSGWLAHRLNPYRTLGLGLALWFLATAPRPPAWSSGFAALIVLRLLLGLGESAAFPCSSKLLAQHLPPARLGAANGLIGVGLALGPAFGTWAGGNLMAQAGWRPAFLIFGAVSALWLIPWWPGHPSSRPRRRRGPVRAIAVLPSDHEAHVGVGRGARPFQLELLLLLRDLVAAPLSGQGPRPHHEPRMAEVGGMIYLVYAASSFIGGWLADRWIAAGASDNLVRKSVVIASHVIPGASLLIAATADANVSIACLFARRPSALGSTPPPSSPSARPWPGPRAAGKWMGGSRTASETSPGSSGRSSPGW